MEADIRNVHVERYYPDVLANAKEFKVIASIENPEFTKAWTALWKQFLNTFVYSLDEDGATRWESIYIPRRYPIYTKKTNSCKDKFVIAIY